MIRIILLNIYTWVTYILALIYLNYHKSFLIYLQNTYGFFWTVCNSLNRLKASHLLHREILWGNNVRRTHLFPCLFSWTFFFQGRIKLRNEQIYMDSSIIKYKKALRNKVLGLLQINRNRFIVKIQYQTNMYCVWFLQDENLFNKM